MPRGRGSKPQWDFTCRVLQRGKQSLPGPASRHSCFNQAVPRSPVQQGFAAVHRVPGALAAEVAWRWCFGTAALGLLALVWIEFLKSIHVTDADVLLLRTRAPLLVADALAHM